VKYFFIWKNNFTFAKAKGNFPLAKTHRHKGKHFFGSKK
jgi:hypothetical protein